MAQPEMPSKETLIAGGTVVDGTGAPGRAGNVSLADGRIRELRWSGPVPRTGEEEYVDARGMVVCPGFVDVHTHSEFTLLADPSAAGRIRQGVTTEIIGNCGLSGGPLDGEYREHRQPDLDEFGIAEHWTSLGEYLTLLERRGPAVNVATLVGHGNIRGAVVGMRDRVPTDAELNRMQRLLSAAMEEGAVGASAGLVYPPGVFSGPDELIALGAVLRRSGGLFAFHMRSEGDALIEAIEEVLKVGAASGVPVHISHLKTAEPENWGKIDAVFALLDRAGETGIRVSADRYPYTASSTDLDTVLPPKIHDGGRDAAMARLADRGTREGLVADLARSRWRDLWERVTVTSVHREENRWAEGKTVVELAGVWACRPEEAVVRILREERFLVGAVFHVMSDENMRLILSRRDVCVGSDSAARSPTGPTATGKPHPRGFGSFPRVLARCVRKEGWLRLEEAVRKMSFLGAETFGLRRRGLIRPSYAADVVVFDPDAVRDRATYREPFLAPEGIRDVWINGVRVLTDGNPTGVRAGMVLRGG